MLAVQPSRSDRIVRSLALGGLAGLVSGLVAGAGARLVMRIFAVGVGQHPAFTVEGTMVIMISGLIVGPAFAVGYILVRRFVPGPWPVGGLFYGLALGALVIAAFSGSPADEGLADPALATTLFATLAVVLGLVIAGATAWIDPRVAVPVDSPDFRTGVSALIGIVGALLLFSLVASAVIGVFD